MRQVTCWRVYSVGLQHLELWSDPLAHYLHPPCIVTQVENERCREAHHALILYGQARTEGGVESFAAGEQLLRLAAARVDRLAAKVGEDKEEAPQQLQPVLHAANLVGRLRMGPRRCLRK